MKTVNVTVRRRITLADLETLQAERLRSRRIAMALVYGIALAIVVSAVLVYLVA